MSLKTMSALRELIIIQGFPKSICNNQEVMLGNMHLLLARIIAR